MEDWSSILNFIDEALQSQTAYLNQQNLLQQEMNLSREEKRWSEQMLDKQNAWNLTMWNATNEYNNPTNQVQRLRDAGLNPLYYGLDGSSANGVQSGQPLGYERASVRGIANPTIGIETKMAVKSLEKDIELKNAQIDSIKEGTKGTALDNEWKDKTMDARTAGVELENSLTKTQIKEIEKKMDVMDKDIELKIRQANTETERQALLKAQSILAHANAAEIVYLLPFRANLMAAQTEAQKAAATASYIHALYEKGLIDGGYVDALCEQAKHNAKIAEYDEQAAIHNARRAGHEADIQKFKSSVRNGTLFTGGTWWDDLGNDIFGAISAMSEALGGSLVPLVAGYGVGKLSSSSGSAASGATSSTIDKQLGALEAYK